MWKIDLNCDIGEGFGSYTAGLDEKMMPYISSANIACGFHAGDFSTMNKTVLLALENSVAIGAHPGLPDLQGFGRRKMEISPREAYEIVLYQIGALNAFVIANGGTLNHVKPHGALYNMAAVDVEIADAIAEAVYRFNPELRLFGLSGSALIHAGEKLGLHTVSEVFTDRTYQSDGTLTPRSEPNALIKDTDQAISQALFMVKKHKVRSIQGDDVPVKADTVCVHGDEPSALEFVKRLNEAFAAEGISIQA